MQNCFKKNEIMFKIVKDGNMICNGLQGFREGEHLVNRGGHAYSCSCTGRTPETATKFIADGKNYVCSECGKQVIVTYDYDDYKKTQAEYKAKSLEDLCLTLIDESLSSGLKYYSLTAKIDRDDWDKVKELFSWANAWDEDDEEQDTMSGRRIEGWVTTEPEKVEKRLSHLIKEENTMKSRKERIEQDMKDRMEKMNILSEIKEEFNNAEKPSNAQTDGEIYQNPFNPENIYGGGEWFVIENEHIWYILNNGHDGDDWSRNNVKTGGAGAIGFRVPFNEELAEKIKKVEE